MSEKTPDTETICKPVDPEEFNKHLWALRKDAESENRRAAADWLASQAKQLAQKNRDIDDALYHLTKNTSDEDFQVRRSVLEASRNIWNEGWETGKPQQGIVLNRVLKVLGEDEHHPEFKKAAADWLGDQLKAKAIAEDKRMMADSVKALLERAKIDALFDVRRSAVEACKTIWDVGWRLESAGKEGRNEKEEKNAQSISADQVGSKEEEALNYLQRQVFRQVLEALQIEECWEVRAAAALWLGEKAYSITHADNKRLLTDSVNALIKIAKKDSYLQVRLEALEACREIWDKGWNSNSETRKKDGTNNKAENKANDKGTPATDEQVENKANDKGTPATDVQATVLQLVLKALENEGAEDDWKIRQTAADWLGGKAEKIAAFRNQLYMGVSDALALIQILDSEPEEVKRSARLAQKAFWQSESLKTRYDKLTDEIQNGANQQEGGNNELAPTDETQGGANQQAEKEKDNVLALTDEIWELANPNYMGSRKALSFLVGCWVGWICRKDKPQLVEFTAEAIRYNRYAVLALIEQLGKQSCKYNYSGGEGGDANESLSKVSGSSDTKKDYSDKGMTEYEKTFKDDLKKRLKKWEENKRDRVGLLDESELVKAERILEKIDPESKDISSDSLVDYINASKSMQVDKRITQQLAEMGNPAFFEEADSEEDKIRRKYEHDRILKELKMHAVPVMLRRLSEEKDDEIRKNIVRMLGYTGDREAVDALARKVASKERKRQSRQDLLSEYYLEPSKKRNDLTQEILEQSIDDSKRNLRLIRLLNIAVFFVGLAVVAGGIYIGIRGDAAASRVAGALAAVGGLAGVIRQLIQDPLDRIQNALAKLVQLETAFTTFIWGLNLNSTFIQSSYIEDGELEDAEIQETVSLVERSADLAMNMIHKYAEIRTDPHIQRLKPEEGFAGSEIILIGEHLLGERTQADSSAEVYIDHGPNPGVTVFSWTDKQVLLELPGVISQGTIYISLFVDGKESNALPFRVW